jgi:predicted MFS family arabinose efflux permease
MTPWLLVVFFIKFGESLALGMVRPFLVDMRMSLVDIGWCLGAFGASAGLLGSLVGGVVTTRVGRQRALVSFAIVQTGVVALYVWAASGVPSVRVLYALCCVENLASGMTLAALFTSMMDVCRRETCGTDYAVQSSVLLVAMGLGSAVSGVTAGALGYAGHFAVGALICLAGAAGAWRVCPPPPRVSSISTVPAPAAS